MVTDSAVGAQEENNLRHLVTNLGPDVPRQSVVPFLTTKHSIDFCLGYADQVVQHGFPGARRARRRQTRGPRARGRARVAAAPAHSRRAIPSCRSAAGPTRPATRPVRWPSWARASSPPTSTSRRSCRIIASATSTGFLREADRQGVTAPGMFGVFYYRSAKTSTLQTLSQFLPVPVDELSAEFAAGATPVDVCARSIRELMALGVRHFYVSNLPLVKTAAVLHAILDRAGLAMPAARSPCGGRGQPCAGRPHSAYDRGRYCSGPPALFRAPRPEPRDPPRWASSSTRCPCPASCASAT